MSDKAAPKDSKPLRAKNATEPLWFQLGFKTCRFPDFYDPSRRRYNLHEGTWIGSGWHRRQELKTMSYVGQEIPPQTTQYQQALIRKEQPRFGFSNYTIEHNISFIHIGKSSGSSVGCHLAESRHYVRKHCSSSLMKRPVPMSALSLSVSCYTHWSGHMFCYNISDAFLVNVRHPIQRMASWFLYEHVQNHPVNYADRDYHCGDLMLFSCYESFDEFVSTGLEAPEPLKTQQLRMGPNLTAAECSHWAWAAVKGTIPAAYHNFYNYDWYSHHMSSPSNNHQNPDTFKEIFVIRSEHFEQDWRTIDGMLGGTRSYPSTMQTKANSAEKKPLAISDRTASSNGILNLCRALCDEIQTYKKLLTGAVNLEHSDLVASLKELQQLCPEEVSLSQRSCKTT